MYQHTTTPKHKVLAYITRLISTKTELLVFKHRDLSEAGIQIPAGTVDSGEDIHSAIKREIEEESGLIFTDCPKLIGSFQHFRKQNQEYQVRHVFHFNCQTKQPSSWSHIVTGKGEDNDMVFEYFWIELQEGQNILVDNQGAYIPFINNVSDLIKTAP